MAGRRRRAGAAPAGTTRANPQAIKYVDESMVLRKVGGVYPEPEFVLEDATVYTKDGKEMANLLETRLRGPFIVRGKLVIDTEEARRRLLKPGIRSAYIEVSACTQYSVGYDDEKEVEGDPERTIIGPSVSVWAKGESGWMDLRPSSQYRPICCKMFEGITIYYEIEKAYEKLGGHKKLKTKRQVFSRVSLDEVFFQYAVGAGDGVLRREVEQRCDDHAIFLLDQLLGGESEWVYTSFYQWMLHRHRDIVDQLNKSDDDLMNATAAEAKPVKPENEDEEQRGDGQSESIKGQLDSGDEEGQDLAMPDAAVADTGLPSAIRVSSRLEDTNSSPPPPPESVLPTLMAVLNEIAAEEGGPRGLRYTRYTGRMYFKLRIKDYHSPKEILQIYAADLVANLNPSQWRETPLWSWLEEQARLPPIQPEHLTMESIPHLLLRRGKMPRPSNAALQLGESTSAALASTSSRIVESSAIPGARPGPGPGRPYSGKSAKLRVSTMTSKKRLFDNIEAGYSDEDSTSSKLPAGRTKAPRSASTSQNGFGSDDSSDLSGSDSADESATAARGVAGVSKLVFPVYKMQTDTPKGPRGTWVCEEDDCGFVVRSANEPEQKGLIHQHIRKHTETNMKLAQAHEEAQRNGVSIGNLLSKIMTETEKKKKRGPATINGKPVPEPIRRVNLGW